MRRRFRFRRFFKWVGTAACGLILLAALACLNWEYLIIARGANGPAIGIAGGAIQAHLRDGDSSNTWLFHVKDRFGERHIAQAWAKWGGVWPTWHGRWFTTPLWIPFVLIGIPTALLWRFDRRRATAECCGKCGYDLTGNVSGRCPECGTASGA